ncbi:hypothetical protein NPIL_388331 [Nephila pilipes]|uniref:Uncharacterized protein n=1 Tax=Nephila pilipes TaxID=299642 RepID=A0A8X6QTE6_NEPPI|nr:hypothetical protein NPIL_388331 [Nephila pilipes]
MANILDKWTERTSISVGFKEVKKLQDSKVCREIATIYGADLMGNLRMLFTDGTVSCSSAFARLNAACSSRLMKPVGFTTLKI